MSIRTSMLMAIGMMMANANQDYYSCGYQISNNGSSEGFKKRIQKNSILREKRTFIINGVAIEAPDKKTARKIYECISK